MNRLLDLPRSLDEHVFVDQYADVARCEATRARSVYLVLDALSEARTAADGGPNPEPAQQSLLWLK